MSTLPTKRIRDLYGMATRWDSDERTASIRESNLAEFDAWIAQHDREVRADALDRAAKKLRAMADEVEASGRDDLEERTIVEVTRDDATLLERQAAQIREGGAA